MSDTVKVNGTVKVERKPESYQCFCCKWTFKQYWQHWYSRTRWLKSLASPDFKISIDGNEHTWYLHISEGEHGLLFNGVLNLELKNDLECNRYIDVKLECSVINENRMVVNTGKSAEHTFTKVSKCTELISDFLYYHPPLPASLVTDFDIDVVCEITYKRNDILNLSGDLQLLLNNEMFSDLTIVVEQQEFRVHKAILASRSPVFLAMLGNDMVEKQNSRVNIADIDYETMKHLLLYVYTGKVEKLELASNLLGPADKYALDGLKNICINLMDEQLTVENVVKTLLMADLYRVSKLKKKALEFMGKHFHKVTETEGFESWLKCNSHLFKSC